MRKGPVKSRSIALIATFLFIGVMSLWAGGQAEVESEAAGEEAVKLTVWHIYNTPEQQAIMDAVIEELESRHPNVTVEDTARTLDADKSATMAALNAGTGPDVVTANNGETSMGPMVRGGYLIDLDPYSREYGWEEDYLSADLWARAKYSDDGQEFGEGSLYGVPGFGELVGVYYNKALFDELGLEVPKNFADFEAVCEELKSNGYTPIAYGSAEMWPFYHLFGSLLGATLSREMGTNEAQEWLQDVVIGNDPDRSFDNDGVLLAAETIKKWADNGYFFDNFTGIKIDDALQLFLAEQAGMFIQGSWYSGSVASASFDTGIFPFPGWDPDDGMTPQVGGMNTPLGINVSTEHKDLAAELLDILLSSDKAHELEREIGLLPPNVPADLSDVEEDSIYYDLLSMWNRMNAENRVGQYLDWTSPGMGDAMGQAGQELLAGSISPADFVDAVEAEYRDWTSK